MTPCLEKVDLSFILPFSIYTTKLCKILTSTFIKVTFTSGCYHLLVVSKHEWFVWNVSTFLVFMSGLVTKKDFQNLDFARGVPPFPFFSFIYRHLLPGLLYGTGLQSVDWLVGGVTWSSACAAQCPFKRRHRQVNVSYCRKGIEVSSAIKSWLLTFNFFTFQVYSPLSRVAQLGAHLCPDFCFKRVLNPHVF